MLPILRDGQAFVTGATHYLYTSPIPDVDRSPRIRVPIRIGGFQTYAVLDTGAPYVVCPPAIAMIIGLDPQKAIEEVRLTVHGGSSPGHLYRLDVTLLAEEGHDLELDTTVYVPQDWGKRPAYIGLTACLDAIRFAIDSHNDYEIFYFGKSYDEHF